MYTKHQMLIPYMIQYTSLGILPPLAPHHTNTQWQKKNFICQKVTAPLGPYCFICWWTDIHSINSPSITSNWCSWLHILLHGYILSRIDHKAYCSQYTLHVSITVYLWGVPYFLIWDTVIFIMNGPQNRRVENIQRISFFHRSFTLSLYQHTSHCTLFPPWKVKIIDHWY